MYNASRGRAWQRDGAALAAQVGSHRHELSHRSLVVRPIHDRGRGPGDLARNRPGPARPAVPAGTDPRAAAAVRLVLRRAGDAAAHRAVADRLLVGRLLLR